MEKNIVEGNKTIAEFMKLTLHGRCYKYEGSWFDDDKLKYHSLWTWLMPVIDKIESVGYISHIHTGHTTIYHKTASFVTQKLSPEKIRATWLAVVDFITFYNQTKNK